MPDIAGPRTCTLVDVPAGAEGVQVMASAVADGLTGAGPPAALLPSYAPPSVQRLLRERLSHRGGQVPDGTAAVLPTSGSTGDPRAVVLGVEALHAAAAARDAAQGGASAWFVVLPAVTAATLATITRALIAKTPLVAWSGLGGVAAFSAESFRHEAAGFLAAAAAVGLPARTSLVSAQLVRLLADPAAVDVLCAFRNVLLGGGPVAAGVLDQAQRAGINVTTTYGMTETVGGCVYDGVPTPGVTVEVVADEIVIGGPCLASGYLDRPLPRRGGMFRTGDRGRIVAGRLQVLGRFDDVVTVRGANVDRSAVAALVADVPGVEESAVVSVPDPSGGQRLVAYIVGAAAVSAVRTSVGDRLGAAAVPEVRVVSDLPLLPGGKVDLQRLTKGTR